MMCLALESVCPFGAIFRRLLSPKNGEVQEELLNFISPSSLCGTTHYVHINLGAVSDNLKWLRRNKSGLVAYLPKYAFGLGCPALYCRLLEEGVKTIVVQTVLEGVHLREQGWNDAIVVTEPVNEVVFEKTVSYMLTVTVEAASSVLGLTRLAIRVDVTANVKEEIKRMGDIFQTCSGLDAKVECIYAVFSDDDGKSGLKKQYDKFMEIVGPYRWEGVTMVCISDLAAVYGLGSAVEACAAGVSLYGYAFQKTKKNGSLEYKSVTNALRPALTWVVRPIHCTAFMKGAPMDGSVHSPHAQGPNERVAVMAVGREDGLPEKLDGLEIMDEKGRCHQLFGPVTASTSQAKLPADDEENPHLLYLLTARRDGATSMLEYCKRTGQAPDELLARISFRVPRIFTDGAEVVNEAEIVEISEMPQWY